MKEHVELLLLNMELGISRIKTYEMLINDNKDPDRRKRIEGYLSKESAELESIKKSIINYVR